MGGAEWGRVANHIEKARQQRYRAQEYSQNVPKPKQRPKPTEQVDMAQGTQEPKPDYLTQLEQQHYEQQRMIAAIQAEAQGFGHERR